MIDEQLQAVDRVRRWRDSGGWKVTLAWLVGYNPQRLLTDQRSELAKFAALHRPFGETYQPILTDPPYHRGGVFIPARRMGKTAALLREEAIIPKARIAYPHIARPKVIGDSLAHNGYSAQIAVQATELLSASMKRFQDQVARWQEKVMLRMLLAANIGDQPGTMFRREARIAKLLFSDDPRQRKRGNRLFEHWRETRSGVNWTRDEKRELLRLGYGRGRLHA